MPKLNILLLGYVPRSIPRYCSRMSPAAAKRLGARTGAGRRQRRIEARVSGDGEQVLGLHVHPRVGDPRLRNPVPDLQGAQPDVGSVLDVVAAALLAAEGVV